MARPNRKKLRLENYDYSRPGAYFITVCTREKQCILSTIVGADAHIGPHPVLSQVGMVVEKYLRNIPGLGAYVIMPNHVHMILHISVESPSQGPVWASAPTGIKVPQLINSLKIMVSKELGQSIWQRSYYDHIIRDEKDYNIHVQYIAENPSKWFLMIIMCHRFYRFTSGADVGIGPYDMIFRKEQANESNLYD